MFWRVWGTLSLGSNHNNLRKRDDRQAGRKHVIQP
jgi:hypothetical protein